MNTVLVVLVVGSIVCSIAALMGKCPPAVGCLLLGVAVALQVLA